MADAPIPFRLAVLQRLTALLEQTTGNDPDGVPHDLTGQVFRGRTEFGDETQLPALSILESPTPSPGIFAGEGEAMTDVWMLLIQGWAKDDKINPSDPAYYLAAAVMAQLGKVTLMRDDGSGRVADKEAHMLGGLIASMSVGPYVVRPLDNKASSRAFFYLPIRISLAQTIAEPYLSA